MEKYTDEDFDAKVIPNGFSKEIRDLCKGAVHLGWTLYVARTSLTLTAPEASGALGNARSIHLSTRRSSGPIQRLQRKIVKYADPTKRGLAQAVGEGRVPMSSLPQMDRKNIIIETEEPRVKKQAAKEPAKIEAKVSTSVEDTENAKSVPSAKADSGSDAKAETSARHVVREEPMMAHRGIGKSYASAHVIERRWSDGVTDYKCVLCDYASRSRHGVGGHWKVHTKTGEAQQFDRRNSVIVDDPTYTEPEFRKGYSPRANRVEALASWLKEHLKEGGASPEEPTFFDTLAREALVWVHEQSESRTELAAEYDEMPAEAILVRIRSLLDRGEYMEQRQKIAELEERAQELEQKAEAAELEATRQRERFEAFRALVNDEE